MNTNIEVLRELDELVEAARLLGVTQAKKLFGCHTDEDRRFERAMYESIDKHRAALLDWEAEPPSTHVGVDFAAVASILRRAMRDGVHYGYRRDFILQQALALEALSQQPAAVDAGLAQRIQALVGGVEVDLEAPLSSGANATTQTHGAMLRQLEPQLQEQLAESEHAAAAQAAEIEALRAEVERWLGECMKVLGLSMQAQAEAKDLRGACDVYQARAERLAEALRKLEGREQSESFLEANDE